MLKKLAVANARLAGALIVRAALKGSSLAAAAAVGVAQY